MSELSLFDDPGPSRSAPKRATARPRAAVYPRRSDNPTPMHVTTALDISTVAAFGGGAATAVARDRSGPLTAASRRERVHVANRT